MSQTGGSAMALQRWELENGIIDEGGSGAPGAEATGGGRAAAAAASGSAGASSSDALFVYNQEEQSAVQRQRLWMADPEYFTHVRPRAPRAPGLIPSAARRGAALVLALVLVLARPRSRAPPPNPDGGGRR